MRNTNIKHTLLWISAVAKYCAPLSVIQFRLPSDSANIYMKNTTVVCLKKAKENIRHLFHVVTYAPWFIVVIRGFFTELKGQQAL